MPLEEKIQTVKNIMNTMLKKEDTHTSGPTPYEAIDTFIEKIQKMDKGYTILTTLVKPESGLNDFLRTLIKNKLGLRWYVGKTDEELNRGGKTRKRKSKRKSKRTFSFKW